MSEPVSVEDAESGTASVAGLSVRHAVARASSPDEIDGKPIAGKVTETLGTGENARHSIVWLTIKWSFWCAIASTVGCGIAIVFSVGDKFVEYLRLSWSIFAPIITLALGYLFGKGGK